MTKTVALALGLLSLPLSHVAPNVAPIAAPATVVLVVRHAEKTGPTGDVPLSAEGEARAQALLAVGRDAGVDAIITTQFQRTRQTAQPLAMARNIVPDVIPAQADVAAHANAIAAAIRERYTGRTVLVVGHSNTVPPIVAALGGTKYRDLCDAEYDALFVVVLNAEGGARTVRSRFGVPSALGAECAAMK